MTRRTNRATGFTLVELLVIMSIFTFLLAGVALAFGTLMRAKAQLQDEQQRATHMTRLAAQVRADAHQALSVEKTDESSIVVQSKQQQIKYVVEADRILRTIVDDASTIHREVYPLASETSIRWQISEAEPRLLSVEIEYEPEDPTQGSETDRIDAVIGLHRRLAP